MKKALKAKPVASIEPLDICPFHKIQCKIYCPFCNIHRCTLCYDVHYFGHLLYNKDPIMLSNNQDQSILAFYVIQAKHCIDAAAKYFLPLQVYGNTVHYFRDSEVTILNTANLSKTVITLNKVIYPLTDSISHGKRIFIMGGNLYNSVNEIDIPNRTLKEKASMAIKKYFHSLCNVQSYIYSIGGFDSQNGVVDCEKYDILSNQWTQLPNLQAKVYACASFNFNNAYIYKYGGQSGSMNLGTFERLNIRQSLSWEAVKVKNGIGERYGVFGIQINSRQSIVFGGYNKEKWIKESYILNIDDYEVDCTKLSDLTKGTTFYECSAPILNGGCVYAVDNTRKIHVLSKGKWTMI